MFERSLVISQQSQVSAGQRWTAVASITVQVALAGLLIALPLLHPEALPFYLDSPRALMPNLTMPKVKPVTVERSAANTTSTSVAIPTQGNPFTAPSHIPSQIGKSDEPPVQSFTGMGNTGNVTDLLAVVRTGAERAVTVAPVHTASAARMRVSEGVSAGLLMTPIRPVYPAIAKAAHVEGTVVVEAIISTRGTIESLHVVSGPEMLRGASLESIRAARYQPFKLNGEPTEVQTTITVNFKIGA